MGFQFTGFADEAGKSLEEQVRVLKALGWSALEVRLVKGTNFCDLEERAFEEAWAYLQSQGIRIAGFGSRIANWGRPITTDFQQDLDELRRNLPRMKRVGAKIIRCMSYPNDRKTPWQTADWKKEAFRRLRELAALCRDAGVILGHENCDGYGGQGPDQTLEMLEAVQNPAFKLILDTGNNALHAGEPMDACWRYYEKVKEHVVHVHIKAVKPDAAGKAVTSFPDEDPVQRRILSDLRKRGYDGWLSIEPHLAAAVHAGKDVENAERASAVWIEYGKRLMRMCESL